MNKRGQFYLIAAVIIIIILAGIFAVNNYANVQKRNERFYDLTAELDLESGRVIDFGIYNQEDIQQKIDDFTSSYLEYSRDKIDAGKWIFVYEENSNLNIITYSVVEGGGIGVIIGGTNTNIDIQKEVKDIKTFTITEDNGKRKFKIEAFEVNYDFELEEGQNFYFLIGSGEGDVEVS